MPKSIEDGDVTGSGNLKKNVVWPLRAAKYEAGRSGSSYAVRGRTALDGGREGPWKRRCDWRNVEVAAWNLDVSSIVYD